MVYDGLVAAEARGADVVIVDTAGRLHTQVNLMRELEKIARADAADDRQGTWVKSVLNLFGESGKKHPAKAKK